MCADACGDACSGESGDTLSLIAPKPPTLASAATGSVDGLCGVEGSKPLGSAFPFGPEGTQLNL